MGEKERKNINDTVMVRDYRKNKPGSCKRIIHKILGKRYYLIKILYSNIVCKRHCNEIRKCIFSVPYETCCNDDNHNVELSGNIDEKKNY